MNASEKVARRMLGGDGLVARLTTELEGERAAKHAACRARKSAAIANYLRDKAPAEAAIKALDDKAAAAQKAAEQALVDYIAARERLDSIRDAVTAVTQPTDREMLTCYDPRIDVFIEELHELRVATPALARSWPDPQGRFQLSNGVRASSNQRAIEARLAAINDAIDAANRLKIDERIDDVAAELARIKNSLPSA